MIVCQEKADVVALDGHPSQDKEVFCTLSQETGELVHQDLLNLVTLLDSYGNPDGIDCRFN